MCLRITKGFSLLIRPLFYFGVCRCAPDDTPCVDDADCALKCCGTTTIVDAGGQRRCA